MTNDVNQLWKEENAAQFAQALVDIANVKTMQAFLGDVLTEKEIVEVSARLEAARMLRAGETYIDIIQKTKLSSRTVARVKDWMQNGTGGYEPVLNEIDKLHSHMSPVHAALV
jgi:TrpR-related protein YerC/YecD